VQLVIVKTGAPAERGSWASSDKCKTKCELNRLGLEARTVPLSVKVASIQHLAESLDSFYRLDSGRGGVKVRGFLTRRWLCCDRSPWRDTPWSVARVTLPRWIGPRYSGVVHVSFTTTWRTQITTGIRTRGDGAAHDLLTSDRLTKRVKIAADRGECLQTSTDGRSQPGSVTA
jgi:hypothetical protein